MTAAILIVDDSLTVRADLMDAFAAEGLAVVGCATVAEAREALATQAICLVILDVLLPDGDGVDLLKEIRATTTGASMPILMLSSEAEVRDRIRGLTMGSDDYVGKPYDRDYVLARARELSARHAAAPVAALAATVLVIDDSITFREQLGDALRARGYDVQSAASGEEGLRSATANRPSAVIVDGVMPGMDGATVIRKLRLDAALRHTPCILLTASSDRSAELGALDAGADAFVRKEEDLDMILARVAAVLRSAGATAAERDTASLSGPKKVLAVDDSPTYLDMVGTALRGEGYDVICARSGEEALEMLATQAVDCILLDRLMPGLGGTETCRRIKASPAARDIPLIMLTAMEDREAMIEGLGTGADDYVLKSAELDVLKARVRAQLRRKQFEDENRRVRLELMDKELEATQARAARALAQSRAELLSVLEQKNHALEIINLALQEQRDEVAQKNRQLEAANRAKTEFLSTMSHELRTPLNAIIGFSEILRDGLAGDLTLEQRKFVGHIHASGDHLLELINDILDLSKIEAGKAEIELEPVDLDVVFADACAVVRERALLHRIGLDSRIEGLPGRLTADRRRVRQILYNLLSNAVKFTPDGGQVSLHATLVSREHASTDLPGFENGTRMPLPDSDFGRFVEISVTDTGIGIARDDMARLFTTFTQIKNERTRGIEGTGLGLATTWRLAELHGGSVAVTSRPNGGSCFTVWLPWRAAPAHDDPPVARPIPSALALVVEDDDKAAELMRVQLQTLGFSVRRATSAEAALQWVGVCTPDLITLDIRLPGMDGWDFLARIKGIAAWAKVPVVVVSVVADHEIGLSLGASAVLQKPVGRSEFASELARLGFAPTASRHVTVLVIDDDPAAVELMATYLNQPGYLVLSADGGRAGIELTKRLLPDLVIVDLVMPEVSGLDVVETLKHDETTATIPVIMVTSKQFSPEERAQLNGRMLNLVDKAEFRQDRFIAEVRRAVGPSMALPAAG